MDSDSALSYNETPTILNWLDRASGDLDDADASKQSDRLSIPSDEPEQKAKGEVAAHGQPLTASLLFQPQDDLSLPPAARALFPARVGGRIKRRDEGLTGGIINDELESTQEYSIASEPTESINVTICFFHYQGAKGSVKKDLTLEMKRNVLNDVVARELLGTKILPHGLSGSSALQKIFGQSENRKAYAEALERCIERCRQGAEKNQIVCLKDRKEKKQLLQEAMSPYWEAARKKGDATFMGFDECPSSVDGEQDRCST
ncbi:hypothetical protein QFC21_006177 [Naganishia friedmannii]|uniref:Uncharacterized protein n=1 Tax=Naganishia friedmannii TaxID=89922 RepID=A0ACC2V5X1_9TREE|nr:hypothetical protein QFC21_006177 [Naganishia friedmannii]